MILVPRTFAWNITLAEGRQSLWASDADIQTRQYPAEIDPFLS
jgi:hypothetical protein